MSDTEVSEAEVFDAGVSAPGISGDNCRPPLGAPGNTYLLWPHLGIVWLSKCPGSLPFSGSGARGGAQRQKVERGSCKGILL